MLKLDSCRIWIFYAPRDYVAVHIDTAVRCKRVKKVTLYGDVKHYGSNIIMGPWYYSEKVRKMVKAQSWRSTLNPQLFWETRRLASMQAVSGDVSWQAQIGAVQSWTQSSSSGHTFLPYLCSKLDLLLRLISCQEFSIRGPLSLSFTISFALLFWLPRSFFLSSCPFLEAAELTQSRNG